MLLAGARCCALGFRRAMVSSVLCGFRIMLVKASFDIPSSCVVRCSALGFNQCRSQNACALTIFLGIVHGMASRIKA
jgi:hypothetical protein